MTVNMGWAMSLAAETDLPELGEFEKLDEQGSTKAQLVANADTYTGPSGWDGVNLQSTYKAPDPASEEKQEWLAQEIWMTAQPDVVNGGVANLIVDPSQNFVPLNEYSVLKCEGTTCTASIQTERVWDTQDSGNGHLIEEKKERAFQFVGWYAVYGKSCSSEKPAAARLLQEGEGEQAGGEEGAGGQQQPVATTIAADGNACWIKGQSTKPQVFVLGALSGVAAASLAILSSMLF